MTNEHTPGPWGVRSHEAPTVWEGGEAPFTIAETASGRLIARGASQSSATFANARLIAAAPDLLAALRGLVLRCDGTEGVRADGSNIDTQAAHAALDAATGGEW